MDNLYFLKSFSVEKTLTLFVRLIKSPIFAAMIQIETIFDILWKGFIIGVIVSAPLGPVGVLCIQRTLNKGGGMVS